MRQILIVHIATVASDQTEIDMFSSSTRKQMVRSTLIAAALIVSSQAFAGGPAPSPVHLPTTNQIGMKKLVGPVSSNPLSPNFHKPFGLTGGNIVTGPGTGFQTGGQYSSSPLPPSAQAGKGDYSELDKLGAAMRDIPDLPQKK